MTSNYFFIRLSNIHKQDQTILLSPHAQGNELTLEMLMH